MFASRKPADNPDTYKRYDEEHSFRISVAELQRLRLRKLQWKLVEHTAAIQCDGIEPGDWEDDLEKYGLCPSCMAYTGPTD